MLKTNLKRVVGVVLVILLILLFFTCTLDSRVKGEGKSREQYNEEGTKTGLIYNKNIGSGAYPFPQAKTFPGVIKPSHRTQTQLNQDVLDYYLYWKEKYVKPSNGNTPGGGYYIEADSTGGHAYPIKSNSEAHGYGMIIFALLGDREYYDGMWNMYNQHRSHGDSDLMSWVITEEEYAYQDGYSATDGDMDIAYSMILAHQQWGSSGTINYLEEAKRMITNGIKQSDMGLSSYRTLLGDWDTNQYSTRSSDWMTDHLRVYREITGDVFWDSAINEVYSLIQSLTSQYAANTGLMPDFIVNQNPQPAAPHFLEGPNDGSYYYNACRFPWRIAMDYAHFGAPEAKAALDKLNTWLKGATANNPGNMKAGYSLAGDVLSGSEYFTGAFAAPFLAGCTVNPANQDYLNNGWELIRNNKESYYEDNVTLLCMLFISGNWWNPLADHNPDEEEPTQPGQPIAHEITDTSVRLSWTSSSDNIGVAGYKIYKDGIEESVVDGSVLTVIIQDLAANTQYSFTVQAFDAAGNYSQQSSPCVITTLPEQTTKHTITSQAGPNGSIDPSGTQLITQGESITFILSPDNGYKISQLLLDSNPVPENEIINQTYTLQNIQTDHSIEVTFIANSSLEVKANYTITSDWGSGFCVTVVIENNSDSVVTNWAVKWSFSGNQQITDSWNGSYVQNNASVIVTPASWNNTIQPGATVSFGFLGTYSGNNEVPSNIIVE
ncbi:MAG: glycosyl hydrolase family 8 [Spirochaetes bacterium]|nr:glycosyl hydrolase family 8 [Spirochaetota bacterium]